MLHIFYNIDRRPQILVINVSVKKKTYDNVYKVILATVFVKLILMSMLIPIKIFVQYFFLNGCLIYKSCKSKKNIILEDTCAARFNLFIKLS